MSNPALTLMHAGADTLRASVDDENERVRRFVRTRDPDLFAQLVRPYEAPLHRLVAATLGPRLRLEVDDCVQDVLIHVFHKLPAFRFESRFSTWLYSVARNRALDQHRRPRNKRPHLDDEALAHQPSADAGPHEIASREEDALRLRSQVDALGEPQRSVVHLFYWAEASIDEIAETMHLKPATVKSHLFRARKALHRSLTT